MLRRPLVFAHRGASAHAPENTIAAFALARELGADGVELDVRRTADGALVVHHDAVLDDETRIRDASLAELQARHPELPTLSAALAACAGMTVNVEIKCLPWEPDPDPDFEVVRGAIDAVRAHGTDAIVSSFFLGAVDASREYAPDIPTAFLVHGIELDAALAMAHEHGHTWLHPDFGNVLLAPAVVERAHALGLFVNVWTVDDPDHMQALMGIGVDAFITNDPGVARAVVGG